MGNFLSRKTTIKNKLLKLEEKIAKTQEDLKTLQKHCGSYSYYLYLILLLSIISIILSFKEFTVYSSTFIVIVIFVALHYFYSWLITKRIARTISKIEAYKKEQFELIKEYKRQIDFDSTKSIIDKREDEESRDSFFKQVQRNKRDTVERFADYVLDNDPRKLNALICKECGVHNGLIDPKNDKIPYFYCFECKFKNKRNIDIKDD